ncbi:sigma factor [Larkinella sp. VNQ87]|uniref:sigma factor n=1 Tax=Larkinella sp. VNQ87 TaxID=3400921 RepID=UPI003BFCC1A2
MYLVKSREEAEEIIQDVFVRIWQRRHLLPTIDNLRSYLFTATRNLCLNYLQKKHRPLTADRDDEPPPTRPTTAGTPSGCIFRRKPRTWPNRPLSSYRRSVN